MKYRAPYAGLVAILMLMPRPSAATTDRLITTGALVDGRTVYLQHDPNGRTESVNREIRSHHIGGRIASCFLLIDLPAGGANGDHSYGGYCVFVDSKNQRKPAEVCDDDMVGHFALNEPRPIANWSETALASFVHENCVGG